MFRRGWNILNEVEIQSVKCDSDYSYISQGIAYISIHSYCSYFSYTSNLFVSDGSLVAIVYHKFTLILLIWLFFIAVQLFLFFLFSLPTNFFKRKKDNPSFSEYAIFLLWIQTSKQIWSSYLYSSFKASSYNCNLYIIKQAYHFWCFKILAKILCIENL